MLKNRILYLMAAILIIWIMVMYQNYYLIMATVTVLIMPLILLFLFIRTVKGVTTNVIIAADTVTKSDENGIPVVINIENRSFIPLTYGRLSLTFHSRHMKNTLKKTLDIAAAGRNHTKISYFFNANNIGIIDVTINNVIYYDFFGLWKKKFKINQNATIYVIPELVHIHFNTDELKSHDNSETEKYRDDIKGNDNGEVFDIREYSEGDGLKNIHWKLSSKKDVLMVKEFSMPLEKTPLIYINMQKKSGGKNPKDSYSRDNLSEAALSLSYALYSAGISHDIAWYNSKKNIKYESDIMDAIYILLDTELNDTFSISGELFEHPYESDYNHIFYVTTALDEEMIKYINIIRQAADTTIIHITKSKNNERLEELCAACDIKLLTAEKINEISN